METVIQLLKHQEYEVHDRIEKIKQDRSLTWVERKGLMKKGNEVAAFIQLKILHTAFGCKEVWA